MKTLFTTAASVLFAINLHAQNTFEIYRYDYPEYPNVDKKGSISEIDAQLYAQQKKHLNFKLLGEKNSVSNTFYYDIKPNVKNTYKLALQINWKEVKEVNIVIDRDFRRDNISLLSDAGVTDIPTFLGEDSISTHFISNRLIQYFKVNIPITNPDASDQEKDEILNQLLEDINTDKIHIGIEVRFKEDQEITRYDLVARNSGFSLQFQRAVDLSLTYVDDRAIGNVYLSFPFRLRTKRQTSSFGDFRWVGDVISFGPTLVYETSTSKPFGIGGFIGIGLSSQGQMTLGFAGGYMFGSQQPFYGLSYNAIGLIDGLVDLLGGKTPAWNKN